MKSHFRLKFPAESADTHVMDSSTVPHMVASYFDFGHPDNLETLMGTCAQLRSLLNRSNDALEQQKSELAQQLHDSFIQQLTAVSLELALLDRTLADARPEETSPEILRKRLQKLGHVVGTMIRSIRKLTVELQPKLLEEYGLDAALRWHCQEFERLTGVECELSCKPAEIKLDSQLSTQVFRVIREAMLNVERHARATRVEIRLSHDDGWLTAHIQDNGRGILDTEVASPQSLGLAEMHWRVQSLGGTLKINGIPDDGTLIALRVPTAKKTVVAETLQAVSEI
jgi:signal transduction histidine kinase